MICDKVIGLDASGRWERRDPDHRLSMSKEMYVECLVPACRGTLVSLTAILLDVAGTSRIKHSAGFTLDLANTITGGNGREAFNVN